MKSTLEARLAGRVLDYLLDPPSGDRPVIEFATPDRLVAAFAETVGLALADHAPAETEADIEAAFEQVIRYSVHTAHPRFLNQNFAGPDPVSVVGDWLGAALNTTGATFEAAPVFTMMESAVLDKLARIAGYANRGPLSRSVNRGPLSGSVNRGPLSRSVNRGPLSGSVNRGPLSGSVPVVSPGLFCPGGSTATLYALQLARHRNQPDLVTRGANAERLVLFVSDSGHYSAGKSAALLGLGTEAVIKVVTDADGAIIPDALARAVDDARSRGDVPFAVIGTAGTTVTAAFDDLSAVADICEANDLWFHVDGCYGGSALFSTTHAHLLAGVERSDSMVWNLHKMLGMTQQCTALLVRDPSQLAPCFAASADYLFQPDKLHAEYDQGDRTFQCARRIDVLKLWLSWKVRGDRGFSERVDHAVDMADHARRAIAESGGAFAPMVSGRFTNVVFAWIPPDLRPLDPDLHRGPLPADVTDRLHRLPPLIKARMQAEGTTMVGYQPVNGINTFRLIFMNPRVTTADVDAVLAHIDQYGGEVDNTGSW